MLPKINQMIKLSLTEDDHTFPLKARVAEVTAGQFWIEVPVNEKTGRLEVLSIGQPIFVFFNHNELGNVTFPSFIIGNKTDQVKLLLIHIPDKNQIKQIQRRDFLRVSTNLEFALKIAKEQKWTVVQTIDLSGGGMQIIAPSAKKIRVKEQIEGWLVLPFKNGTIEHVYITGEAVRIITHPDRPDIVWIPIKFLEVKESKQPVIIRYCYQRQMEMRNKGVYGK